MRHNVRWSALVALVVLLAIPLAAQARTGQYAVKVYLANSGANSLAIDPEGSLTYVAPGTGQMDGSVVRLRDLNHNGTIDNRGEQKVLAGNLPSMLGVNIEGGGVFPAGPQALAWSRNSAFSVITNPAMNESGAFASGSGLLLKSPPGNLNANRPHTQTYANLANYEATVNPDGQEINPNPFAIVLDTAGNAYVNDAGGNATLKITPDGTISTFALYPSIPVPPEVLGMPFEAQPVPTGIAIGSDGAIYVGQLTGFPFLPGTASVFRLQDLNGDGDALDPGEQTVFATGLTTVTSIAFGPDGTLYASEFRGPLTSGDESAPPPADGDVVRWTGSNWETVVSGLLMPTSIAVAPDGSLYILGLDGTILRATAA